VRRDGVVERAVLQDMFERPDRKWRSPGASAWRGAADEHVLKDMSETGPAASLLGLQGAVEASGRARDAGRKDMSEGRGEA
jgi:hypothetical protein